MMNSKTRLGRPIAVSLIIALMITMMSGLTLTGFAAGTTVDISNLTNIGSNWGGPNSGGVTATINATGGVDGYDGGYYFSLKGNSKSYPQYMLGLPEGDYTGLKKIRFWVKATGARVGTSLSYALMNGGTKLADVKPGVLNDTYTYVDLDVTDTTKQDFATLNQLRIYYGADANSGTIFISKMQLYIEKDDINVSVTLDGAAKTLHQYPGAEVGYGSQAGNALTVNLKSTGASDPGSLDVEVLGTGGTANDAFTPSATTVAVTNAADGSFTLTPKTGLGAGDYNAAVNIKRAGVVMATFNLRFVVIVYADKYVHVDNTASNRVKSVGAWAPDYNPPYYPGENSESFIETQSAPANSGITIGGGTFSNKLLSFGAASRNGEAIILDYKNVGSHNGRAIMDMPSLNYSGLVDADGKVYASFLVKNIGTGMARGLTLGFASSKLNVSNGCDWVVSYSGIPTIEAGDSDWKQIKLEGTLKTGKKVEDIKYLGVHTSSGSSGKLLISDIVISACPIDTIDLTVANTDPSVKYYVVDFKNNNLTADDADYYAGSGAGDKIDFSVGTGEGYLGANAGKYEFQRSAAESRKPMLLPTQDYTGITHLSFLVKNTSADFDNPSFKLGLRKDGSSNNFTTPTVEFTSAGKWMHVIVPITDALGEDFANLKYLYFYPQVQAPGDVANVIFSDIKLTNFEPDVIVPIQDPSSKEIVVDFDKNGLTNADGVDYYPGNGPNNKIDWTTHVGAGFMGANAGKLAYIKEGDHASRKASGLPVKDYEGVKYLSFLVKNSTENGVLPNFKLGLREDKNTSCAEHSVTFTAGDYDKWKHVIIPITDATGNDFANLKYLFVYPSTTTATETAIYFTNITFSTNEPEPIDLFEGIKISSLKINGIDNPTSVLGGENDIVAHITNTSAADATNAIMIVGVYTNTGMLKSLEIAPAITLKKIPLLGDNTYSLKVNVPEDSGTYGLRLMIWDSTTQAEYAEMRPVGLSK